MLQTWNALRYFGLMNASEVTQKLSMRGLNISEREITVYLETLVEQKHIRRSDVDGYFYA
jgi:repressor of nif and glnA expression